MSEYNNISKKTFTRIHGTTSGYFKLGKKGILLHSDDDLNLHLGNTKLIVGGGDGLVKLNLPTRDGTIALTTDVPDFGFDSDLLDIEFLNDTNSVEKPTIKLNPKTDDPEEGSGFFYRKSDSNSPLIYTGGLEVETINKITLNSENINGITLTFENYNTEKMDGFLIASDMDLKFRDISDKGILYSDNGVIKSQNIIGVDHGGTGVGTGKELDDKNLVFASDPKNDNLLPTFRKLVADDIPEELNHINVKGVRVTGDLIVDGKHIVKQSGTLSTEDDMIFLRGGAKVGLSINQYSGLVITSYNNEVEGVDQENLGIVVDNQGTAYLGKVNVDKVDGDLSGKISGVNLKPLVTRVLDRSRDNGAIMVWNAEDNSIVPLRKPKSETENDYLSYNKISFEANSGETGFHFNTETEKDLGSVSFELNQKEDLKYTLVNNNKMFSSVEIDNVKEIINAGKRQDSLKFKSTDLIDVTGNRLDNTISFNLKDNYGDVVNPYGKKGANTVLISPLDGNGNPVDGKPEFRGLINADLPDKNHTTGRFSSFSMDSKGTVTGGRHVIVSSREQPGNPLIADGLWVNESDGNLVKIKKSNESEYTFEDLTVENAKRVLEKLIFTTLDGKVEFDGSDEKEVHLLSYPEVVDESKKEDSTLNAKTMSHGSGDEHKQVDAEHLLDYTNLTQKPTKIGHIYGNADGKSLNVNDVDARQDLVRIIKAFGKYGESTPNINEGLITKELYENIMTLFEIVVGDQDENNKNIIDRLQEVYEFLNGHEDDQTLVELLNDIDTDITTLNTKVDTGIDRLDGLITNLNNGTVKLTGDQTISGKKIFNDLRLGGVAGLRFLDEDNMSTVLARIVTNAGKLEITDSSVKNGEIAVMSDIPTKTSDLDNDSDFTNKLYVDSLNFAMSGDLTGVKDLVTEINENYVSKSTFEGNSLDGIKELTGATYLETSSDIHLNGSNILLTGENQKVEFTVDEKKVEYYGRHIDLDGKKIVEYTQDANENTSIYLDGNVKVRTDVDITDDDIRDWNAAYTWGNHEEGGYAQESKRLSDKSEIDMIVADVRDDINNLESTKQDIHARITSFINLTETGFIRLKNVEGNEIEIDKTDYLSSSDANNNFVKKLRKIAGIELREDITEQELRDALEEATTASKGLMSKEDKTHLNSIVEMFYDDGTGNSVIDRIQQVLDLLENFEEGNTLIDILSTKENIINAGTNISFSETDGKKTISAVDTITKLGTDTLTSGDFKFKVDNKTVSGNNIVSISESKNGNVNEITVTVDPEHHSTVAIENDVNEDTQSTTSLKHGQTFTIIESLKRDNNGHIIKQDRRNISLANLSTTQDALGDSYGPVVSVAIDPEDPNKIVYKKSNIYLDTTTEYSKNLVYASDGQDDSKTASFRLLVPGDLPSGIPISKIENLQTQLNDKVVKVTGKGLSTNDFTNTYKTQLDNAVPNTRKINGYDLTEDIILNLDNIGDGLERKLSDYAKDNEVVKLSGDQTITGIKTFTGDSLNINTISIQSDNNHSIINSDKTFLMGNDIIVDGNVYVGNSQDNELTTKSFVQGLSDTKVDKEEGKGLSTNDFTNDYKTKLDNAVPNTRTIAGHSLKNDISVDALMDSIGLARKSDTVYVRGLLSAADKELIDDMARMFYEDNGGILDKIQDIIDAFDGLDDYDNLLGLVSNKVDKDTIASSDTLGLVRTGYVTSGKKYKLEVDLNGNAFVDVPWTNTTYTSGNNITINGTEISAKDTTYTAGTNVSIDGTVISAIDTKYNKMTSSTLGLGKLASPTVQTTLMNSISSTSERTYGIQANSSDQLVVNVPWTDTTYTAGTNVSINGNEISATDTTYNAGTNVSIDGTTINATDTKYTAGTHVTIDENNVISATDTKYNLASSSTSGLVKLGYTTNNSSRNYKLDTDGSNMFVNVPWTDTKYTAGENISINGTTISATDTTYDNNTFDDIISKSTINKLISGSLLRSQFYLKSEADSTIDSKIDAALVSAMNYMGSKDLFSSLPTSGNSKGDFWNVTDTGFNYAWNGSSWDQISGLTDLSAYAKKADYTPITSHNQLITEVNEKVSKTGNESINGVKTFKETVEADKGIKIKESRIEFNETTRSIDFIFA